MIIARRIAIVTGCLSTAALAVGLSAADVGQPDPAAPSTPPIPSASVRGASTTSAGSATSGPALDAHWLAALERRGRSSATVDPFSPVAEPQSQPAAAPVLPTVRSKPAMAPPAAGAPTPSPVPVAAAPSAAAPPFRLIGRAIVDGEATLFLESAGQTYSVRAGEALADGWRLESVSGDVATFERTATANRLQLALSRP